ncbi:MAG: glycoside hydrolase family 108 protein [Mesorhizobium sp.]|uniref:glycoside hydrolase family 108 protein n=1 Tax=Mesorhizobium sp. TaxID=1871066 RepID=UPI001ACF4F4E|nr:glycosyl hydrolase 108 family protein [Mesorhizobium sp.]MBN9220408.1 glycoside hydrolase family 108 protein [Mesorhizobium sp.]
MDRNFARALSLVLKSEGGWSDNPADPGGATMKGVTLANFRRYVKADATRADLREISDEQVATVYRRFYWDAVAGAELPDGVDYAVFDFAVNSGPGRAAKYLQATIGVTQDGRIGPTTIGATRARPAGVVIDQLCDARLAFLRRLATWPTFGRGWSDRVKSVRAQALLMSAQLTTSAPAQPPNAAPAVGAKPSQSTSAGNTPSAERVPPASQNSGIAVAAKAGGLIAACLLAAYAAWHHIAAALQGIF